MFGTCAGLFASKQCKHIRLLRICLCVRSLVTQPIVLVGDAIQWPMILVTYGAYLLGVVNDQYRSA